MSTRLVPQPAVCAKKNKKIRGTAGWAVKVTGHKSQVEKTLRFDLHLRLAPSRRPAVWLWPPAALLNIDRLSPMLLAPDMREWVPQNDMVHFVLEAVEDMNLRTLSVNERGTGNAQYPPAMMLALVIYCYANGMFGSRRIERATYRDVAVRYLTGDTHPDHDTIAKFRRENFDLQEAEKADKTDLDEGQSLPEEIARKKELLAKLEKARATLAIRAKAKLEKLPIPMAQARKALAIP